MRVRCLCQICTCGRHRCPQGATRIYGSAGVFHPTTEYLEKYPRYGNVLPPPSLKPKQQFQAYRAKMEGVTTFKSDYRPYEVIQPPRHIREEYKPKQGKIDFGTTYKRDFNSYTVQPVVIVRPLERKQLKKGKLDTVPTYKGNLPFQNGAKVLKLPDLRANGNFGELPYLATIDSIGKFFPLFGQSGIV